MKTQQNLVEEIDSVLETYSGIFLVYFYTKKLVFIYKFGILMKTYFENTEFETGQEVIQHQSNLK